MEHYDVFRDRTSYLWTVPKDVIEIVRWFVKRPVFVITGGTTQEIRLDTNPFVIDTGNGVCTQLLHPHASMVTGITCKDGTVAMVCKDRDWHNQTRVWLSNNSAYRSHDVWDRGPLCRYRTVLYGFTEYENEWSGCSLRLKSAIFDGLDYKEGRPTSLKFGLTEFAMSPIEEESHYFIKYGNDVPKSVVYDCEQDRTIIAHLGERRIGHSMVPIDRSLLIVGGVDKDSWSADADALLYDHRSETTTKITPMAHHLIRSAASKFGDSSIVVFGGYSLVPGGDDVEHYSPDPSGVGACIKHSNEIQIYDLRADRWHIDGDLRLPYAVSDHRVASVTL